MNAAETLRAIRERRPLVHCITNDVTVGRVADALAALGALPVMASAEEEAAEMAEQAQALLLNLGTPRAERWRAAAAAGERARAAHVPVVLDPVGCGATTWRTEEARRLAEHVGPSLVRGNLPEVAALAEVRLARARLRGISVDPDAPGVDEDEASRLAVAAADRLGCTVLVTGPVDWLSDGRRTERFAGDAPSLARLVGAGDVLAAVLAACCAVEPDAFAAARAGVRLFASLAREVGRRSSGPGTFWPTWMDAAAALEPEALRVAAVAVEAPG